MTDKTEVRTVDLDAFAEGVGTTLGLVVDTILSDPAINKVAFKDRLLERLRLTDELPNGDPAAVNSGLLAEKIRNR